MAIIEASGLARDFKSRKRTVHAVRGVDLTVEEGEIVGFLGPNGAGKTTTLRMLTTLLRPTAGTATVAGADLLRDPLGVRKRIGFGPPAIRPTPGGSGDNSPGGGGDEGGAGLPDRALCPGRGGPAVREDAVRRAAAAA